MNSVYKEHIADNMKHLDETSFSAKRRQAFKIPENYFEEFACKVMDRIPQTSVSQGRIGKRTFLSRLYPYVGIAAICILVFGMGGLVFPDKQEIPSQQVMATVSITGEQAEDIVDDVCDFTMIEDSEIYAYATGNE